MNKIKIYANCKLVRGVCRSVINDIQRHNFSFIPNSLYDLLIKYDACSIDYIKNQYNNKFHKIIDEYINFLLNKEYVFFTVEPNAFPIIQNSYIYPSIISNAVVSNQKYFENYKLIIDYLNILNCKALQFRMFEYQNMEKLMPLFNDSTIQEIEILLKYNKNINISKIKNLFIKYQRIWTLRIYNAPQNDIVFLDKQKQHPVFYTTQNITNHSFCGNIHPNNFVNNITFFTESLHYNTCLNRKLCIDENGYIKNCPSMSKHYGHISNTNVAEVVQSEEFQKLWHIKKDDIKVCKDCEFRHMCMDCRAYIKNPNDIYSQPAKCPYNPYIAKWQGQEGYITVEQWQKQNPNWEQQAKEQRQTTY